jgi:hypothetical protein
VNTQTTTRTLITFLAIIFILSTALFSLSCTDTKAIGSQENNSPPASDAVDRQKEADEPVLFPIRVGDKGGYIDVSGKVVVDPQYEGTFDFAEGRGRIGVVDYMYGFIDSSGKVVIEPKYDLANEFSEGLAVVCEGNPWGGDGKWGFIDEQGNYAIKPQFAGVMDFHEGLAAATLDNRSDAEKGFRLQKWGFIDIKGNFTIQPEFNWVGDFSEDLAAVMIDRKMGYIDKTGKVVIQPQYGMTNKFSQGLASVLIGEFNKGGKFGYIDKTGKMVIDAIYDRADEFSEGLAAVRILTDEKYSDITGASHYLTEGTHDMKGIRGRWAYIDRTGRIIIEPKFDEASSFSDGIAAVCIGNPNFNKGKWGYIDTSGNYVMDPQFTSAGDFKHGLATAKIPGWTGYINKEGALTWSTVEEEPVIMPTPEGNNAENE